MRLTKHCKIETAVIISVMAPLVPLLGTPRLVTQETGTRKIPHSQALRLRVIPPKAPYLRLSQYPIIKLQSMAGSRMRDLIGTY